jgi:cation transport ATPase
MDGSLLEIVGVALGLGVLVGTGYWLSRTGLPYGQIRLAVHKLVSVALLGSLVWTAVAVAGTGPLAVGSWLVFSLAVLTLVVLIATGGVLSATASARRAVRRLHQITPYVAIGAAGLWLYLL